MILVAFGRCIMSQSSVLVVLTVLDLALHFGITIITDVIIIIELIHSKTILENIVEIEPTSSHRFQEPFSIF